MLPVEGLKFLQELQLRISMQPLQPDQNSRKYDPATRNAEQKYEHPNGY
jgi:hypothetical protein